MIFSKSRISTDRSDRSHMNQIVRTHKTVDSFTSPTPILDTRVITELVEDLDGWLPVSEFISRYSTLLDRRIDRLDCTLKTNNAQEWLAAIQSLEVSSAMAGATALSQKAAQLQECVPPRPPGDHHWPTNEQRTEIITGLRHLAEQTRQELNLLLRQPNDLTSHETWLPAKFADSTDPAGGTGTAHRAEASEGAHEKSPCSAVPLLKPPRTSPDKSSDE